MYIELVLLNIKNNEISLYNKVDGLVDGSLCITQYERNKETKELLHLGVMLKDIANPENYVVLIGNDNMQNELTYDKNISYFYHKSSQEEDRVGISKSGFFKITVLDSQRQKIYTSDPVLVKPSIITEKMYKDMVKMLLNINKDLALDESSSVYLNGKNKEAELPYQIKELLSGIEKPLYNINTNPGVALIKEDAKIRYNKIKKVNRKILIEKEMYPFKDKFVSKVTTESKDTFENRAIYCALLNIKRIIEVNLENSKALAVGLDKEFGEVKEAINANSSDVFNMSKGAYVNELNKKRDKILDNINELAGKILMFNESIVIISEYLNLNIFKEYKKTKVKFEELKITQVFLHETWYKLIYVKLKSFYEQNEYELYSFEDEQLNIRAVYDIFEIWTFFEMVRVMTKQQGWKLNNRKYLIKELNEYLRRTGSLYGFKVNLEHKLATEETVLMEIIYNKTIYLEDKNLRPDYTFRVKCKGEEKIFYLDAKYHNYKENMSQYFHDVQETACNKYYNSLIRTQYKASGSFIIHCMDGDEYVNFGPEKENNHRVGIFSLTSENSNNFKTWISLIMEWVYNEHNVCWSCGCTDVKIKQEKTKGDKWKFHYTCNGCGSFWVKSHCACCSKGDKIIKHDLPQKQYHKLTSEKWMVNCPMCGKSGLEKSSVSALCVSSSSNRSSLSNRTSYTGTKCRKCGGTGRISVYKHIEGGRCFACNGSGRV